MGRQKETQVLRSPFVSSGIGHLEQIYSALEREVGIRSAYETMLELIQAGFTNRLPASCKLSQEQALSYKPLLLAWFEAFVEHPTLEDDIGAIMEVRAFETFDQAGQFLTPSNISRMMAKMILGNEPAWDADSLPRVRPLRVIDPACGTGRMLMAVAQETVNWRVPLVLAGSDVDVRMTRATILNLILANAWREAQGALLGVMPKVIWANSLQVELLHPDTWKHANQWDQPHWSSLPVLGSGRQVEPQGLDAFLDGAPTRPVRSVAEARDDRILSKRSLSKPKVAPDASPRTRQAKLGEA